MSKVVISGYYGFKNFGDEAILSVLVNHLKSLGNIDITVFSSDVDYTSSEYDVKAVNRFNFSSVIDEIRNCDVLISGGGSLLQDVTSVKSLIYYSLIIALGVFFNKKVIIFAQGIGPLNSKISKIIIKNLLKYCSLVTVRDDKSLKLLNDMKIDTKLVCDPIYSISINNPLNNGAIGVQLRNFKTMNDELLQKLALLIITKFYDRKIEIFSLQKTQDLELAIKFESILKSYNPDMNTEIVQEKIIERLSKLDYLFGMRFHAILVALKSGVKTCAINYDQKVEKIAKDFNIPIISMDVHENLENVFCNLNNLNTQNLIIQANHKQFDWSIFDELFFRIK